jgi:prepilin-type N-terminal cleavage/methylation domain-containing protein
MQIDLVAATFRLRGFCVYSRRFITQAKACGYEPAVIRSSMMSENNLHLNPRILDPLNPLGVTLIELISVIAIIGILAVTLIPRINFGTTSSTASANGAAYMIASDIRYTQEFAMANMISKSIQFSAVTSNKYTFNPVSAGMDPSGQLSGATIGTTVTFTFNSLGEPTTTAGWTVTVSAGGVSKTITVLNYTGKVSIS